MSKGINQVINLRSHGWSNKIYVVMPIFVKLLKFFFSGHGVRAVLRTTQLISLLVWSKRTICTRLRNSQVIPFFRPNPFNQTLIIILWWGSNPINQLYYPCVRLWIHHMAYTKYTPDSVKPTLEFHINYQSRSICLELFFKNPCIKISSVGISVRNWSICRLICLQEIGRRIVQVLANIRLIWFFYSRIPKKIVPNKLNDSDDLYWTPKSVMNNSVYVWCTH